MTLNLIFSLLSNLAFAQHSGIDLIGKVQGTKNSGCESGKMELFLAEKLTHTLLFQVDVIAGGSFQFHLKEGTYEIKVKGLNGCEGQEEITLLPKEQSRKITINVQKKKGH